MDQLYVLRFIVVLHLGPVDASVTYVDLSLHVENCSDSFLSQKIYVAF